MRTNLDDSRLDHLSCHVGLEGPPEISIAGFDAVEHLHLEGPQRNVQLKLENIEAKIVATLVIERGLLSAFAKKEPKDEKGLQQQMKAALAAAEEKLQRESPTFTYSLTKTTPDFSDAKFSLFVEAKLLTPKRR